MSWRQLIHATPDVPGREGMCLEYVRKSFGLPIRYASATEAWQNSTSKHTDRTFPPGVDHPVWYGLASNVNGHVVTRMADGSVYSTSDYDPTPVHHHPSLEDLEAYYARYDVPLTYRGWTEDVAGFPVIQQVTVSTQSGDVLSMTTADDVATAVMTKKYGRAGGRTGTVTLADTIRYLDSNLDRIVKTEASQSAQIAGLVGAVAAMAKGEQFDQAKLLAGVQAAAETGAEAGVKAAIDSIDTTVTIN